MLDNTTGRVVNSQVTPIPLSLDGATHTLSVPLNAISSHAAAGATYRLQLMPGSLIYGLQRSAGLVTVNTATVQLPFSD